MNIIHYFLGFPPYRSGGLTKYVLDLMIEQKKRGNKVIALWPGRIKLFEKAVGLVEGSIFEGIRSIEVINPLPISLDEGIKETRKFTKKVDKNIFVNLLKREKPDVIHVHTLMGLHKEFILVARELGVHTVFTTHDYFGLCPKVTFFKDGCVCDDDHDCMDCVECNKSALSMRKIFLLQSRFYRDLKDSFIIKILRKRHRDNFFEEKKIDKDKEEKVKKSPEEYQKLREFYVDILNNIDLIHFNSTVSKRIYEKFFTPKLSVVLSLSHRNIKDFRNESLWRWTGVLRITYLSPAKSYKGFNVIKKAMDRLWNDGEHNIELKVFSPVKYIAPYMSVNENGFVQKELMTIFNETDILVAPSVWYETFGFTVLEALSYGVPVIVSDHVGAKDIVQDGGFIVKAGSSDELYKVLRKIGFKQKISDLRRNVLENVRIKLWSTHVEEISTLYLNLDKR